MRKYAVTVELDSDTDTIEFTAKNDAEAIATAKTMAHDWVTGGCWGDEGNSIDVDWTLTGSRDRAVDAGRVTVEIEINHAALIRAAGGDPDCDHDWTSDGEGGLDENPGVWSTGGTGIEITTHCRRCGLQREWTHTGSQRNPGETDTVSYAQPSYWCDECKIKGYQCDQCEEFEDEDEE